MHRLKNNRLVYYLLAFDMSVQIMLFLRMNHFVFKGRFNNYNIRDMINRRLSAAVLREILQYIILIIDVFSSQTRLNKIKQYDTFL